MKMRTLITTISTGTVMVLVCGCDLSRNEVGRTPAERAWWAGKTSAQASAAEMVEPKILPKTHFAAALLLEQEGDIEKAIIQYRKAAATNHQYVEAYNRLGILLGRQGRHVEAENALRRVIALKPRRAALHNNLGYELALQGRWLDAETELNQAIRLKPQLARAYVNLGLVLSKQDRFEEALEAFNAVLPEVDAFYNLGLVFAGAHRYQDAADAFHHALTLNPQFAIAQQQLDFLAPMIELAAPLEPVNEVDHQMAGADDTATEPPAPQPAQQFAAVPEEAEEVVMLTAAVTGMSFDEPAQAGSEMAFASMDDLVAADSPAAPSKQEISATSDEEEDIVVAIEAVTTTPSAEPVIVASETAPTPQQEESPAIAVKVQHASAVEMPMGPPAIEPAAIEVWRSPLITAIEMTLSPPPEIAPLAGEPTAVVAELTAAESEDLSSQADDWDDGSATGLSWITYEPCEYIGGSDWLAPLPLEFTPPASWSFDWSAPAASAPPVAVPWSLTNPGGELDAPHGEDRRTRRLAGWGYLPLLYPSAPELTAGEFVHWIEPCPVDSAGF